MKLVTIEFIKDTEKRSKGDRLRVDFKSAESFVNKGVARRTDESVEKAAPAKAAPTVADPVGDDDD